MTSGNQHQRKPTSRTAISEAQKEEICNYARSHPNDSNGMILAWARQKFRPDFPQSTLSTMLSKKGIITRKKGGRGRPPAANIASAQDNWVGQDIQVSPAQHAPQEFSVKTGLKMKELQRLAGARFRGRNSVYNDVEVTLLEEIYDTLRLGKNCLTLLWFRERAQELLLQTNAKFQRKYLCQFLEQLYAKYYLTSVVAQYLKQKSNSFTYESMLQKLALKFPGLKYAPVPELERTDMMSSSPLLDTIPTPPSSHNGNQRIEIVDHLDPTAQTPLPVNFGFGFAPDLTYNTMAVVPDLLPEALDLSSLESDTYPMHDDSMLSLLQDSSISISVQDCDAPCQIQTTCTQVSDYILPECQPVAIVSGSDQFSGYSFESHQQVQPTPSPQLPYEEQIVTDPRTLDLCPSVTSQDLETYFYVQPSGYRPSFSLY